MLTNINIHYKNPIIKLGNNLKLKLVVNKMSNMFTKFNFV